MAPPAGLIDRRTFFLGLLLAVAVMLAGSYIMNRMLKSDEQPKVAAPSRPVPPPAAPLAPSPFVTDVKSDAEAVAALSAGAQPKVILAHAGWCGHCRTMMGSFVEAAAAERGVAWIRVESNVGPSLVRRSDLRGFPTIYGVGADGSVTQHDGPRDAASLLAFARALPKAAAPAAQEEFVDDA